MIGKSKLGAIALVAAIGVASPVFAQGIYSPAENGGGSAGYNAKATGPNYRLGPHHTRHTGKLVMHHPITGKQLAQPNKNK